MSGDITEEFEEYPPLHQYRPRPRQPERPMPELCCPHCKKPITVTVGAVAPEAPARRRGPRRLEPAMPTKTKRMVGYQGLFAYLGGAVAPGTLRRKVTEGSIPFLRTGPRSVAFDLDAIDEWLTDNEGVPAKDSRRPKEKP